MTVDNPYTGEVHCEVPYFSQAQVDLAVDKSAKAQKHFAATSTLDDRIALCNRFLDEIVAHKDQIAADITAQMGKPLAGSLGEINGLIERSQAMMDLAPSALAEEVLPKEGFERRLLREPVGTVVTVAPWNFPLMCAGNSLIPAVLAGNSVLLKHSERTPLCGNHFEDAFRRAGAPEGLVQALHSTHEGSATVFARKEVGFVSFTGSVRGGRQVYASTAANNFADVGLELGGKDAAYVAEDADVAHAADNIVDGGLYNNGQSCCGIERVYVHRSHYEEFCQRAADVLKTYKLGDPTSADTNMGPMALPNACAFLEGQVQDAVSKGAKVLVGGSPLTDAAGKGRFFAPTLVMDCDHTMSIAYDESFGPVLAVMPVDSDEEAIARINDSPFGLTASLWTPSVERARAMAPRLEVGTVFMNRCDYLDPYLAWTGVKDTGKGVSLSSHGFDAVTQLKSIHFRL